MVTQSACGTDFVESLVLIEAASPYFDQFAIDLCLYPFNLLIVARL